MLTKQMQKARRFAQERHDATGQQYAGQSHVTHLDDVVAVLDEFNVAVADGTDPWDGVRSEVVRVAAFLHDVIEDTKTTLAEVLIEFGPGVAILVFAVTDEPGKNRAERHELTYPKIVALGEDGVNLKLADRLANVRASIREERADLVKMYKKEWPKFRDALWALGDERMKDELKGLLEE